MGVTGHERGFFGGRLPGVGIHEREGVMLEKLLTDPDAWTSVIIAFISSGMLTAFITLFATWRKDEVDAGRLAAEAAHEAVDIMRDGIIKPLREQVDSQNEQIEHLDRQSAKFFASVGYIRALCHWLDPAVRAMEPACMAKHPKPHLPDSLRDQVNTDD